VERLSALVDREELVLVAVGIALEAVRSGHRPFGALVASGNQVVGTGMDISHSSGDPTDHAEIGALRAALAARQGRLVGCDVYSSCEPCIMCTGAILRCGISAVYFAVPRELAAARGYPDVVSAESLRATIPPTIAMRCLQQEQGLAPFLAAQEHYS
jgi:tRNA(Arg) A34 adenosine deaminase TadA